MKYTDLNQSNKNHVNGVLAKHMDSYIRTHKVWTPEQMYEDLIEKLKDTHSKGWYGSKHLVNGEWIFTYKESELWMVSNFAKLFILDRFNKKYLKNQKLARKNSPLIERARFGLRWDNNKFYDINYGLKDGYNFQKTDIVENNYLTPWSIEHVENELLSKYNKYLIDVLKELSESPIEVKFYEEWIRRYYDNKNNPALIPEFCGTRKMFYCYKNRDEYTLKHSFEYQSVNVRFDFAIVNFKKQTMLLLELDGHDYHKTKKQRINDSIKRAIATNDGWQMNVITGTQISNDIDSVFDAIKNFVE